VLPQRGHTACCALNTTGPFSSHRHRPAGHAHPCCTPVPPLGEVPNRLPGGGHWVSLGGNWAGGWDNPLGADYGWMTWAKAKKLLHITA
jgi:hypothetical protein